MRPPPGWGRTAAALVVAATVGAATGGVLAGVARGHRTRPVLVAVVACPVAIKEAAVKIPTAAGVGTWVSREEQEAVVVGGVAVVSRETLAKLSTASA